MTLDNELRITKTDTAISGTPSTNYPSIADEDIYKLIDALSSEEIIIDHEASSKQVFIGNKIRIVELGEEVGEADDVISYTLKNTQLDIILRDIFNPSIIREGFVGVPDTRELGIVANFTFNNGYKDEAILGICKQVIQEFYQPSEQEPSRLYSSTEAECNGSGGWCL